MLLQVLRFDPPATALEFIQSRGRARAPQSRMVLMAEAGNEAHARLIQDVRRCAPARRAAHMRPSLLPATGGPEPWPQRVLGCCRLPGS